MSHSQAPVPPANAAAAAAAPAVIDVDGAGARRARTATEVADDMTAAELGVFFVKRSMPTSAGPVDRFVCAVCFPIECGVSGRQQSLTFSVNAATGVFAPNGGKFLQVQTARRHLGAKHGNVLLDKTERDHFLAELTGKRGLVSAHDMLRRHNFEGLTYTDDEKLEGV